MTIIDQKADMPRSFKPLTFEFIEDGKRAIKGQMVNFVSGKDSPNCTVYWNDELKVWVLPATIEKKKAASPKKKTPTKK